MKDFVISILDILEQIKKLDYILGFGLIGIMLIVIIFSSESRKLVPSVFSTAFDLYRTIIFKNKYFGIVFLIAIIAATISVFILTESIITAVLFLVMPFKIIYTEIDRVVKDKSTDLFKSSLSIFWKLEKGFLSYSITYYLVLLKLPTELKNIINFGFKEFIGEITDGELNVFLILILYSLALSTIIIAFIIDMKRFTIIESDILAITSKSKYNRLSKLQVEKIIVGTKYFKNVKVKSEILKIIAYFNKYEYKDFHKLLKSSVNLYYYLGINSLNKKQFYRFLEILLHCCDDYNTYVKSINEIMRSYKIDIIDLMENIENFWEQKCSSYICYNKKRECMDLILSEIKR